MRTARLVGIVLIAATLAALVAVALTEVSPPERLREVYTPTYRHMPSMPPPSVTVARLWHDLRGPSGQAFWRRILPNQAGVLWLSLIVALLIAFDFDNLANPRNVDLLAMQAVGVCLFEVIRFLRLLQDPVYVALMAAMFSVVLVWI